MNEFITGFDAFAGLAKEDPQRGFLNQPFEGEVLTWTRAETLQAARSLAAALQGLGLAAGDRVALLSKNCAEWVISDLAIAMAGLVSVPIYPSAGRDTIAYVLNNSQARALIIGKLDDPQVPASAIDEDIVTIGMRYPRIDCRHDWLELVECSDPIERMASPAPDDPMTVLFTSGSTGAPKGVVISHRAYAYNCQATRDLMALTADDRTLSYLPLAHITERTVVVGPCLYSGAELYFADSLETFPEDLARTRATLFLSVPRLWVRFQSMVHAQIPPGRLKLLLRIPLIGSRVAARIRRGMGFEQCRVFGSGSAPISPSTLRWWERLGVEISEGWGMSETSGVSCSNIPFRSERVGSIGAPITGTEMKLSNEGEILLRGPGLFSEYHDRPDLTAEAFTEDGFFRTGDCGEWDAAISSFRITGRLKEQFKSAKGKYVSPVPIESQLAGNPLIEQVCVMGAGLRAPIAVVVLSPAAGDQPREAVADDLRSTLERVNGALESHERLSNLYVADEEWTVENDLLTPTLKIKRDRLENLYGERIRELGREPVVWAVAS